ncbi:MAG: hypothetical protein GWP06_06060 [Actinobacteria bacterium]|nr:hypothetical protein [Actinomycetota bacterium]
MKATYDSSCDYKVLYVNSHTSDTVINKDMREEIRCLPGVEAIKKQGSYGMELMAIYDSDMVQDEDILINGIENVLRRKG